MKIFVSKKAEKDLHSILDYLRNNWNEKVAQAFIKKTADVFTLLEAFPEMGQVDFPEKQIRGFQMVKQVRLIYRIKESRIIILSFFDVRQNPNKNPGKRSF
ncbi:MAG TPA: type II toxin-antitoxin system RelE/ParE family toxin [Catalimonadaceae bacterium]|nr:type II toxin-antitoxin system RelE/ParE family toxin [Catalimonadaceae bacterium]HPI10790.1 type II toxin-antitoxin system RelE/ParE family toxin [Catalimonadaceae bacterium]